jgi:superfamily I DNA/RNA helicase
LIVGAPGSGKTQILLHRAAYLRDASKTSPDRFRIFVFTNVLKDYIRSACEDLRIPLSCASTFDAWCCDYYRANISRRLPWDYAARAYDFIAIRAAVGEHTGKIGRPLFEFVLVDEGQDLDPEAFGTLLRIARHVTVCADYKQQIYRHGSSEEEIAMRLGLSRRNLSLLEAFRCSAYIVPLASEFIADSEERQAFARQTRTAAGTRETPLLYHADDFDQEKRRLIEMVRVRLGYGERIAVLLPRKSQVFGFATGLREHGLEVEVPARRGQGDDDGLDFASNLPKLLTYHSAKGLTFDSVLMPRLVSASFPRDSVSHIERLLFVGITRAARWVYLSTVMDDRLSALDRLQHLATSGKLTIQTESSTTRLPPKPSAPEVPEIDDLL